MFIIINPFFERKMEISGLSIGGKKMKYKKFENTIIARIDKGEDIVEQVKQLVFLKQRKRNIMLMNLKVIMKLYLLRELLIQ